METQTNEYPLGEHLSKETIEALKAAKEKILKEQQIVRK